MTQNHANTKKDIKKLILRFLSIETGDDYTALEQRLDIDINCDTRVDSLNMVNIAIDLEDALGIKISDEEIIPERLRSLNAFADFLVAKTVARGRPARVG